MKFTLHCTINEAKPKDQWPALTLGGSPILFDTESAALHKGALLANRGVSEFHYEARPVSEKEAAR